MARTPPYVADRSQALRDVGIVESLFAIVVPVERTTTGIQKAGRGEIAEVFAKTGKNDLNGINEADRTRSGTLCTEMPQNGIGCMNVCTAYENSYTGE